MRRRRTLLLVSALAALAFVAARVLYRIVFGGGGSGATALPSLPPVRLGGPFSHVVLFGPVTLEGLGLAALSALPFAGVILATGILVSLVDPRNLIVLAPRVRWGSSVVLACGIAVSTFPVVVQSVGTLRKISALRGLSPGLRLFVPVLETTLERAMGMAVALESRGIRGTRASAGSPVSEGSVSLKDFTVTRRLESPVSWGISPGAQVVLTGATGSGKTTLLEAIAGVLDIRETVSRAGLCDVGVASSHIAYVPHNPHTLFLTSRVIDDVALGLIARGTEASVARKLAAAALDRWGLSHLATREPHQLSSGEAAVVALVMVVLPHPALILLDEPLSAVDEHFRGVLLSILRQSVEETGASVVLTDHPRAATVPAGYEVWQLGEAGVTPGRFTARGEVPARVPYRLTEPDTVLRVSGLSVTHGDHQVLRSLECAVVRGEILLITGDNGAGKSTLLNALVSDGGGVHDATGQSVGEMRPSHRVSHIALVPSDPGTLFMTSSVAEELALADRSAGVPAGFSAVTCQSLVPGLVEHHAQTHPRDLSRGQQAALAIALQLSHKPAVVLLDEPTRGLDEAAEKAFAEVVCCVVETGTAVVIAAHHRDGGSVPATRVLSLTGGVLVSSRAEVEG